MVRNPIRHLARDTRGATIVEFAIIAPVMCLMLVGAFDVAHTLYTRATLQGILQKAARDSTLETGSETAVQAELDEKIRKQVRALANNSTITFTRSYYRSFTEASSPRAEVDANRNGICEAGEKYEDTNGNGRFDADGKASGQGGAKDATLYTVTVTYPKQFPLWKLLKLTYADTKLTASTVLRNQPYSDQGGSTLRTCP